MLSNDRSTYPESARNSSFAPSFFKKFLETFWDWTPWRGISTTLANHVGCIVGWSSEKEMPWVETFPIVAMMEDAQFGRKIKVKPEMGDKTVGTMISTFPECLAVSTRSERLCPVPASRDRVNYAVVQQPPLNIFSHCLSHDRDGGILPSLPRVVKGRDNLSPALGGA